MNDDSNPEYPVLDDFINNKFAWKGADVFPSFDDLLRRCHTALFTVYLTINDFVTRKIISWKLRKEKKEIIKRQMLDESDKIRSLHHTMHVFNNGIFQKIAHIPTTQYYRSLQYNSSTQRDQFGRKIRERF